MLLGLLGSGWQRINRPKPACSRGTGPQSHASSKLGNRKPSAAPPAPGPSPTPSCVLRAWRYEGDLTHLVCLRAPAPQSLVRQIASHGLREARGSPGTTFVGPSRDTGKLPGRDWRERARTRPWTCLFPPVRPSWLSVETGGNPCPLRLQAVAWEGGGILLPHYRWRGASETEWWDTRCRKYAS